MVLLAVSSIPAIALANEPWDCSKIKITEFKFAKDCRGEGLVPAKDERDPSIKANPNCSVSADIGGRKRTLNYETASAHWRDNIGLSHSCRQSSNYTPPARAAEFGHTAQNDLSENCSVSLRQASETPGKGQECKCEKFGCGQVITEARTRDLEDLKRELNAAVKAISPQCNDLNVAAAPSSLNGGGFKVALSSQRCPMVSDFKRCPPGTYPRNLRVYELGVTVVCLPPNSGGDTARSSGSYGPN